MSRDPIGAWIGEYFRCWREKDSETLGRLFTPDAVYYSAPFREPHRGTTEILAYWERATATQVGLEIRLGSTIQQGNRASVEWWAAWTEKGKGVTLLGCLVLQFAPDGRCEELREYWQMEDQIRPPPEEWNGRKTAAERFSRSTT